MIEALPAAVSALGNLFDLLGGLREKERNLFKQHLEFMRDQLEAASRTEAEGKEKYARACERIADLERQINGEFVFFRGAAFRRLPSGRLDRAVYCPVCRVSTLPVPTLSVVQGRRRLVPGPFKCSRPGCGWVSQFRFVGFPAVFTRACAEHGAKLL